MSHNTTEELNIELSDDFWDCECEENFIHQKSVPICDICNSHQEEQPDSRLEEIEEEIEMLTVSAINEIGRVLKGYITTTTVKRFIQNNMRQNCNYFNTQALTEIDEKVIHGVVDFWRHTIESTDPT